MRGSVTVLLVAGIAMVGVLSWMSSEDRRIQEEREMRERIKEELKAKLEDELTIRRPETPRHGGATLQRSSSPQVEEELVVVPPTVSETQMARREMKERLLQRYEQLQYEQLYNGGLGSRQISQEIQAIGDQLVALEMSDGGSANSFLDQSRQRQLESEMREQEESMRRLEEQLRRQQQEIDRQKRELESQSGPRYGYN